MPAAPRLSRSLTSRQTLRGLPYPVSASTRTGTLTALIILIALSTVSPEFSNPKSGIPSRAADDPYPVWNIASKPTCSAILALSASKTPGSTIILFRSSSCSLKDCRGFSCIAYNCKRRNIILSFHRPPARCYQFHKVTCWIPEVKGLSLAIPVHFLLYGNTIPSQMLLACLIFFLFNLHSKVDAGWRSHCAVCG